jgi:hypothetical protein
MNPALNRFATIALTCGVALGLCTIAAAQKPAHPATRHARPAAAQPAPGAKNADRFKGIAAKLGTTPQALESAYQAARQANPNLTPGQFVAANVVAHNLSAKNPNITTQAILDGLKSGKTIGQTLHALGMPAKDAWNAQQEAEKEASAAETPG